MIVLWIAWAMNAFVAGVELTEFFQGVWWQLPLFFLNFSLALYCMHMILHSDERR